MPATFQRCSLGRAADSCIGCNGFIGLEFFNDQAIEFPAQTLQVIPTQYWQPGSAEVLAVRPYGSHCLNVLVCGRADAQAKDVPEEIQFRLSESNLQLRCRLSFSFFSKSLEGWSPARLPGAAGCNSFNLLLIGAAGTAKSSFINSALTLLSPSDARASTISKTGGLMAPTTTSLNAFPVPGLSLIIRDTWGTTSAVDCSQLTAVFPLLVEGCLPSGWKLNDEPMEAVLKVGKSSRFRRRAHAVMFCITASLLSDGKADKDIECIRNLCVQLSCLGYEPLLMISKADLVCPGFAADTLGSHPELEALKHKAAHQLGIGEWNISFGCNYEKSESRSFQVDRLTYHILDMAMRRAKEFCQLPRPLLPFKQLISGQIDLEKHCNRSRLTRRNKNPVFKICSMLAPLSLSSVLSTAEMRCRGPVPLDSVQTDQH